MFRVESDIFIFHDDLQRVGECHYDVVINDDRWIVIFTELLDNPGPSITNAIEHVISQFCRHYNLNYNEVSFYERYQSHPSDLDVIDYQREKPIWYRLSPEESSVILKALT